VKLRGGASGTTEAVIDFAKPRLGFRCPKAVTFVDTIPKTPYGKVDRPQVIAALTLAYQAVAS
jgi:acyl-coenzyme A synthetase/AMP-(fatty) acid ligase